MFDRVYFINLQSAQDRHNRILNELEECGLLDMAQRVDAVRGTSLSQEQVKQHATATCAKFCSRRLIGCAMSHMKTWQMFLDDDAAETALILEDDAMFTRKDVLSFLSDTIAKEYLPQDWDVLYLGCFTGCDVASNKQLVPMALGAAGKSTIAVNDYIVKPALPLGTHAYVVTRAAAERLLNELTDKKISNHVDIQMNEMFSRIGLNVYALRTPLVVQQTNLSVSNIAQFQFPVLLNQLFDKIEDASGQSLAYKLSVSLYETCPATPDVSIAINLWMMIFIFSSLLLWKLKVSPKSITAAYAILFILDFVSTNGDTKVIIYAITYYLILLLPHAQNLFVTATTRD